MAYADWDITGLNARVDNTTLPNPLPQPWAGQYCREIGTVGTDTTILINAGYQGGAFVGTSNNKVIRIRGCIRRVTNTSVYIGGFSARWANYITERGYSITYDALNQTISLYSNRDTGYPLPVVGNVFNPDWFSVEMIIYPLGDVGDRVVCSQELTPGSGVYTPLSINGGVPAEGIIFNNLQVDYVPATNPASRIGILGPSYGNIYANFNYGNILVDKVNIALSNVP